MVSKGFSSDKWYQRTLPPHHTTTLPHHSIKTQALQPNHTTLLHPTPSKIAFLLQQPPPPPFWLSHYPTTTEPNRWGQVRLQQVITGNSQVTRDLPFTSTSGTDRCWWEKGRCGVGLSCGLASCTCGKDGMNISKMHINKRWTRRRRRIVKRYWSCKTIEN